MPPRTNPAPARYISCSPPRPPAGELNASNPYNVGALQSVTFNNLRCNMVMAAPPPQAPAPAPAAEAVAVPTDLQIEYTPIECECHLAPADLGGARSCSSLLPWAEIAGCLQPRHVVPPLPLPIFPCRPGPAHGGHLLPVPHQVGPAYHCTGQQQMHGCTCGLAAGGRPSLAAACSRLPPPMSPPAGHPPLLLSSACLQSAQHTQRDRAKHGGHSHAGGTAVHRQLYR